MRNSIAAFALFRRAGVAGQVEYLAGWNASWKAFHLIGGHREAEESFRACCVREVEEELGLVEGRDFRVAGERLAHLEYVHWSERAQADTAYTLELFEAELSGEAAEAVVRDENNRWLNEGEIRRGRCADGKAVSPTLPRILEMAGLLSGA
jgi:8-oxo-dGTP pyrophosphatase MutT (NUDIX family)